MAVKCGVPDQAHHTRTLLLYGVLTLIVTGPLPQARQILINCHHPQWSAEMVQLCHLQAFLVMDSHRFGGPCFVT